LIVTEEGFPVGYEVFAGNTHDSKTVQSIVESLEKKYGTINRVWVFDRGMVSEANLKFLRERGSQYIVGTPKSMLRQFEQHLVDQDWTEAQAGVEVKLVPSPDGQETFILARSADRRAKELAMHEKFVARMELGLKKIQAAAEAKLKSGDVVLRAGSTVGGRERRIALRCVTEPDRAQTVLLQRLGLTLPRRLRRLDDVQM
jgi:transposase